MQTATYPQHEHPILLFLGAFVSTFFLAIGLMIAAISAMPTIASYITAPDESFVAQLPLSADRGREDELFDIAKPGGKQLFPAIPIDGAVDTSNWIRIPAIDVGVPLVESTSVQDSDILAALDSGAALYPNNVLPGHLGNTFIAAHSTGEPWKGAYRFAFLRINELEKGNTIHIDYNGTRYTYRVTEKEIVTPTDDLRVTSHGNASTMTLMACWPLWSTQQRMLIHAQLTNITCTRCSTSQSDAPVHIPAQP